MQPRSLHSIVLFFLIVGISNSHLAAQEQKLDSLFGKFQQFGDYLLYRNHDSTYIQNYSSEFTLRLIAVNKFNYFSIRDRINNSTLRYRPDRRTNLGVGFAYKWFSLDVAFNMGIGENSDFQNEDLLDFQANIFSSKQYIAVNLQYYYGYRLTDFSGLSVESGQLTTIRDDIRTIRFGLQYIYAFNYDKFSLKASFILNEKQLKSAGSWLLGASFNMFIVDGDSSLIPANAVNDFEPQLNMVDLNSLSLSLNAGYMYSFIFKKHFFITLGFIPGFNLNKGDYRTQARAPFPLHLSLIFNTMNALGYNGRRFYGGIQFIGEMNNIRIAQKMTVQLGHGKAKAFFGYRFQNKKSKKSAP